MGAFNDAAGKHADEVLLDEEGSSSSTPSIL